MSLQCLSLCKVAKRVQPDQEDNQEELYDQMPNTFCFKKAQKRLNFDLFFAQFRYH